MSIKELVTKFEEASKNLMKEAQETLGKELSSIIAKYPEGWGVTWTQYTTFFNDGDECVFNVHECYAFTHVEDVEAWGDTGFSTYLEPYNDEEFDSTDKLGSAMKDEIGVIINQIPKDIMKGVFGNHAQVIVTAKEVVVEEYDHD